MKTSFTKLAKLAVFSLVASVFAACASEVASEPAATADVAEIQVAEVARVTNEDRLNLWRETATVDPETGRHPSWVDIPPLAPYGEWVLTADILREVSLRVGVQFVDATGITGVEQFLRLPNTIQQSDITAVNPVFLGDLHEIWDTYGDGDIPLLMNDYSYGEHGWAVSEEDFLAFDILAFAEEMASIGFGLDDLFIVFELYTDVDEPILRLVMRNPLSGATIDGLEVAYFG
ncbi:MAG: hypothetical protein FWG68_10450 [Defluviitaleaceae bacterium]|nr:hypothetical protein [Defluviitaleaceae bacterium]